MAWSGPYTCFRHVIQRTFCLFPSCFSRVLSSVLWLRLHVGKLFYLTVWTLELRWGVTRVLHGTLLRDAVVLIQYILTEFTLLRCLAQQENCAWGHTIVYIGLVEAGRACFHMSMQGLRISRAPFLIRGCWVGMTDPCGSRHIPSPCPSQPTTDSFPAASSPTSPSTLGWVGVWECACACTCASVAHTHNDRAYDRSLTPLISSTSTSTSPLTHTLALDSTPPPLRLRGSSP